MPSLDQAQLSSLGDGIDELARRAAELADQLEGAHRSEASSSLFEAERSLRMAERAVERARRTLDR